MELAIELFGYLILTILGLVLPIVAILLSVFQEGISKLAQQYQAEIHQSEENLKTIAKAKRTDLIALQQSIEELKSTKKRAETKLSYLNIRKQILRLFIPLVLAFLGVVVTSILIGTNFYYSLFLLISLTGFVYAIIVLWNLIGIIIEVRRVIDAEKKATETSTVELLTSLAREIGDKKGEYFLKEVYITLGDKDIEDDSRTIAIQANSKRKLRFGVQNHESRMVKNVEIGFIFPTNFIIEKEGSYSIYRDEDHQIVRYESEMIHGNTHLLPWESITIIPLEAGNYRIRNFVKAENVESTYRYITVKVT